MEFVKSKRGEEEEEKKGPLLSQIREINDFLEDKGTPYIGGDDVCATDLKLGPQLKHIVVGGKQIKVSVLSWTALHSYGLFYVNLCPQFFWACSDL
jgi:hypothetical protein